MKLQKKALLTGLVMVSIAGTVMAGGVNNTINAGGGADAVGNHNTVEVSASSSFAAGYMNKVLGDNAFVFGTENKAKGSNSFAGGNNATAGGRNTFAFGSAAEAIADYTVAIGSQAKTSAANTIAIGNGAYASGESSVVYGRTNNVSGKNTVVVGADNKEVTAAESAIVGYHNTMADNSKGQLIFGSNSKTSGEGAIAVGTEAQAVTANSIALGAKSVTGTVESTSSLNIGRNTYNFAGGAAVGTLSIGDSNAERTITNVAAGRVSATSTDAVNGSQLHAIKDVVDNHENRITTIEGDINTLNNRIINGGANSLNEAKAYTDQQVSSVAAASAALAGLHPLDFDKHDKWSYSVGFGNYKNANAAALGAFYRPNKNTMFNVATTVGNGRNMISLGANFKFGKSSEEVTTDEATQLKRDMKDLSEKYNELAQKYNELVAKLESK